MAKRGDGHGAARLPGRELYLFAFVSERLWPSGRGAAPNDGPRRRGPLVNHGTDGERAAISQQATGPVVMSNACPSS